MDLIGNSSLDALGVVLEKEHSDCVRSLSMRVVPIVTFMNTTTKITYMNLGFLNSADTSFTCCSNV
ncbi:hypothetical protein AHAS_Ahas07G0112200 [Arachis hypogaea]